MHPTQTPVIIPEPGTDVVTPAVTLRSAATYLDRYGWIQGCYYDTSTAVFTPAACVVGALGMVCYGRPVTAPAQNFDDPGWGDFEDAMTHLHHHLRAMHVSDVYTFNDDRGRTADQVITALNHAADDWDRLDALHTGGTNPIQGGAA